MVRFALIANCLSRGSCLAQGDLPALLASQPDLSTLLEVVGLVDGLAETLAAVSNITIVAPTNQAFAQVPRDTPEGQAVELRNDTIAIGALLANHVFKGAYPAEAVTDIPTFAQTLLDDSYMNAVQPFSNFTGGAYNGLVKNGKDVCILSGEQTISTVTQVDIKLGEGITIHKIDTVLSFGAPLELFLYRAGYLAMSGALEAAQLGFGFGLTGAEVQTLNISDFTILVPEDAAFEYIGSVVASADKKTLQEVLRYHIIPNNVIFSPSLGNVTVKSLQVHCLAQWLGLGQQRTHHVPQHHFVQCVLSPLAGEFDRASLTPSKLASERLAFAGASPVSKLPFSSVSFDGDLMAYTTTPVLLQTVAAVATASATANATASSAPTSPPVTGDGIKRLMPCVISALSVAAGIAAFLV
ncbi:hypothetical protein PG993_003031 [Apiospora rasikravindrae]|uniref:FAS1 domain-containing protein n=1 Tax=Apiospora rasikravindrae TaxID=990691 RepID=A0ABR1TYB2_9PEZI